MIERLKEMLKILDKTYLEKMRITWGIYKGEELIGSCGYEKLRLKTITAFTKDNNSNTIRFLGKLGFMILGV